MTATDEITVAVEPLPARPALQAAWLALEPESRASFFQTWDWIGCWLETTGLGPRLLIARRAGRVVGLALLHERLERRPWGSVRAWYLNRSGDPRFDTITIEYNGILAERGGEAAVGRACLEHLLDGEIAGASRRRRLYLDGVSAELYGWLRQAGAAPRVRAQSPCPYVELGSIGGGGAGGAYLDRLSRNTRHQIRRSIRLCDAAPAVEAAADVDQALAYFDALKALHQAYWTAKGKPGAFAEPFFERFHQRLIAAAQPAGRVELLQIAAAGRPLGYLYNLLADGEVYSYQSGFAYRADNRFKPGLVAHALAIEDYRRRGFRRYHLMAGAARYKASLASDAAEMYWLTAHRHDWPATVAGRLRRAAAPLARRWRAR